MGSINQSLSSSVVVERSSPRRGKQEDESWSSTTRSTRAPRWSSCSATRATRSRPRPTASRRSARWPTSRPISCSPISRCRGWTASSCSAKLREHDPDLPVIVMTAFGEVETAVRAMRAGARDYLAKPVNVGELSVVVARELEQRRLRAEAGLLRARLAEKYSFDNIIGSSAPDAGGLQDRRADRAVARERPHHRRVRHRQGADRRGHPRAQPARQGAVREAALRGARRVAARERAVRPRARRVHRRADAARRALLSRPTAARCSSTRSARSRRRSRSSSCASCRSASSSASAATRPISVDVRVIAATNREPASRWSPRGSSARISTIA